MSNKQFTELLESSEGLTQQFKEGAAKIFEQAVQEGIDARLEEKTAELKESLYQEVAERGAVMIKEESEKNKAFLEEQAHKYVEQITDELKESVAADFRSQVEKLTEAKQEAEDKLTEQTAKYQSELEKLNESVEKLAAEKSTTEVARLEKKLGAYADYIAEQYVAATKDSVKMTTKAWLGEQVIGYMKDLLESYGVQSPAGVEAFDSKVKELTEQRDQAYAKLSSIVEENRDLECELNESKKATALAVISEGLTISDRKKLASLMEGDRSDIEKFTERAKTLCEQFKSESSSAEQKAKLHLESVNIVSDKPVVEEKVESKKEQVLEEQVSDPEVDYFVNALKNFK